MLASFIISHLRIDRCFKAGDFQRRLKFIVRKPSVAEISSEFRLSLNLIRLIALYSCFLRGGGVLKQFISSTMSPLSELAAPIYYVNLLLCHDV